jgi:hypothetical protein
VGFQKGTLKKFAGVYACELWETIRADVRLSGMRSDAGDQAGLWLER